jgi:hypothetical protein
MIVLEVSSAQQFEPVSESELPRLAWLVDGVLGGRPDIGMISQAGLYVAPPQVPQDRFVTVTARSIGESDLEVSAQVLIAGAQNTPYVEIVPDLITAVATDSVKLVPMVYGCESSGVAWSIELLEGEWYNIGLIRQNGTYVAPSDPDGDLSLMVIAQSTERPDKFGIANIIVKEPYQFFIELEAFTDSSGSGITRGVSCGGGAGVTGLNTTGEWISVPITVETGGKYLASVRYAAGDGDDLRLTITAEGCWETGGVEQAEFILNQGSGVGG